MEFNDTFRAKGLRKRLVDTLISKGISDEKILKVIGEIPRHLFLDSSFIEHAYEDKAFPIGADQTISQPYTVAFQSILLDLKKGDKILEIGTGSGYQTAVLCELGVKVFTIERQRYLYKKTSALLKKFKYRAFMLYGDGFKGMPNDAPFDKIIVTCGAPELPNSLLMQLKVGGFAIIPVGQSVQEMKKITRVSDTKFKIENFGEFRFVPMLKNTNNSNH